MTRFAIGMLARSAEEVLGGARIAERYGCWALGVADSHFLYDDCYPVIAHTLLGTESIRVGPFVTNCVARSWSIHASSARANEEIAPGRGVLGLAVGDGSVYSVGLKPQPWASLEADVGRIRDRAPTSLPIHLSASGPKGARHAGRCADAIVVATGADPVAIRSLVAEACEARATSGVTTPFETWADVMVFTCETEREAHDTRERLKVAAVGGARFCFDQTLEGKNVPDSIGDALTAGLARYSHLTHGVLDGTSPNDHLFDDRPDVLDYLRDRMLLVGTRDQVGERLERLAREAQVDGLWLSICWPDCLDVVQRTAEVLGVLTGQHTA